MRQPSCKGLSPLGFHNKKTPSIPGNPPGTRRLLAVPPKLPSGKANPIQDVVHVDRISRREGQLHFMRITVAAGTARRRLLQGGIIRGAADLHQPPAL
ncbi:MAG: hypothetical protein LBH09_02800 [Peptococcaceae bacterium]|nr:hypothetical protein [Peptococcaceae bacterium]